MTVGTNSQWRSFWYSSDSTVLGLGLWAVSAHVRQSSDSVQNFSGRCLRRQLLDFRVWFRFSLLCRLNWWLIDANDKEPKLGTLNFKVCSTYYHNYFLPMSPPLMTKPWNYIWQTIAMYYGPLPVLWQVSLAVESHWKVYIFISFSGER